MGALSATRRYAEDTLKSRSRMAGSSCSYRLAGTQQLRPAMAKTSSPCSSFPPRGRLERRLRERARTAGRSPRPHVARASEISHWPELNTSFYNPPPCL